MGYNQGSLNLNIFLEIAKYCQKWSLPSALLANFYTKLHFSSMLFAVYHPYGKRTVSTTAMLVSEVPMVPITSVSAPIHSIGSSCCQSIQATRQRLTPS